MSHNLISRTEFHLDNKGISFTALVAGGFYGYAPCSRRFGPYKSSDRGKCLAKDGPREWQ